MPQVKIKSIVKLKEKYQKYDISVPETNNFFANGVLVHNSSGRFCHQQVRNLSYLEKFSNRLSDRWQERCLKLDSFLKRISKRKDVYTWKLLAGSRTVVKDSIANQGYYKHDIWNDTLDKIGHLIPKNWIIYGELIGYAGQSAIQKNYTYGVEPGKCEFYVYRISIVNEDGIQVDLSWDTIKSFCKKMNLKHVPELWSGYHRDFKVDDWMDKRYADMGFACPALNKGLVDEGVVVRREGILPLLLKAKANLFILHESKQLDTGEVDIESLES